MILLRTVINDPQIKLLLEKKIPFVTAGSSNDKRVKQVDHDHETACKELTSVLLMRGMEEIAILGGDEKIYANIKRISGVKAAYAEANKIIENENIFLNLENKLLVEKAVDAALSKNANCLLCMDDAICSQVLHRLKEKEITVPTQVKVASFYNSSVLENNNPSITSLSFDAKELGRISCKNLLAQIENEEVADKVLLSYNVVLRESTK